MRGNYPTRRQPCAAYRYAATVITRLSHRTRRRRGSGLQPAAMAMAMAMAIVVKVTLASGHAQAGGLVVVGGSPRAIGRAGTGTVGDNGAARCS